MDDLEKKLAAADPDAGKLLITDGVFSMEGDLCDLPGIVALKKKYNFRIMVDDAHGLGVMGEHGLGTGDHFGLHDDVDLIMGTFSKSFGSIGGVIAGERDVVDWIKHRARSMIFAASMSPANVAAALAALDLIEAEPERRKRLWQITHKMHAAFKGMGFDTGVSVTPIIPILIGEQIRTFDLWKMLLEAGVFTNAVIPPAVEPGRCMLRTSYQAAHTEEQLDRVLDVFETLGKRLKLIQHSRPATTQRIDIPLKAPEAIIETDAPPAMPRPIAAYGNIAPLSWRQQLQQMRIPPQLRDRVEAAWALSGLPRPNLDLDRLQRQGQAAVERVRDTLEAVTYRAASIDTDQMTAISKKLLARVRRPRYRNGNGASKNGYAKNGHA
jgi:hypothetical protein